jgi:DNA (cytosine-5)-methyltransferase 1
VDEAVKRRPQLALPTGLIIDNFAGGGGASTGIELALGRSPDLAVNHDPEAVAMHEANHPSTRHLCGDVWDVDPVRVCSGRPVALAWFSPDCKHHSKAKGGKPRDAKIRGLAWVVVRWARAVRPAVIMLENVEEFADWGPLRDDGTPHPDRKGWTFRRWVGSLEAAGYVVESRELRACDYGAPTTRKRLFVIARRDGLPIVWPSPTHGPGRRPYRTAADCIDWSLPCPSIFERERPLADKTLARIARGIRRFVIESARPFIVPTAHAGDHRVHSIDEPLRTVCGGRRGDHALVAPTLIQTGYGERPGQSPRSLDLNAPLGTVVGCGAKHALVAAFLAKHYGGHEGAGSSLDRPVDTVTAQDHHSVVAAFMKRDFGQSVGQCADAPAATVTAGGGGHLAEVRAFLIKYYGQGTGQALRDPLDTVPTHDRFGLVTVAGEQYRIADIGMRMLSPRELFRAQGFDDSYIIDPVYEGKPLTKTAQIRMAGNSVCPPVAAALVAANVGRQEVAVA